MLSIDPDTIVSADAASRQLGQRPAGASGASRFPHRGQVAVVVILFVLPPAFARCAGVRRKVPVSDEQAPKGYAPSAFSRYLSSSSISAGSETVSEIAARSSARKALRSR